MQAHLLVLVRERPERSQGDNKQEARSQGAEEMGLGGRVRISRRWSGQDIVRAVRARAWALSATASTGQLNRP